MTDDMLQDVRAAREAFARAHNYDLEALVATLRKLDACGDRKVVRLPPRQPVDVRVAPVPALAPQPADAVSGG